MPPTGGELGSTLCPPCKPKARLEAKPAGLIARLREVLVGTSEAAVAKRLAGTVFLIRVLSAGLAYFSQVLLARWIRRFGLRHLRLCLDLGVAARQRVGFRHCRLGAKADP